MKTSCAAAALLLTLWTSAPQSPQAPTDAQVYEAFRTWVTAQPASDYSSALERDKQVLAGQGVDRAEVDRRITLIVNEGRRLEVERWKGAPRRPRTAESGNARTAVGDFGLQKTRVVRLAAQKP